VGWLEGTTLGKRGITGMGELVLGVGINESTCEDNRKNPKTKHSANILRNSCRVSLFLNGALGDSFWEGKC